MAARTSALTLHEKWREKIGASMLINRLRNHAIGRIEMSPTQLRAAEILLRKVVPDLSAVEHTGEITHNYVAEIPARTEDAQSWQQAHTPPSLQ